MNIIFKNVTIADQKSAYSGKVVNLKVEDGLIAEISTKEIVDKKATIYDATDCFLSPGWCDVKVNFREPGNEQKEDINSGTDAAAKGGFTSVLVMPSTNPPLQSRSDMEFVIRRNNNHAVSVYPSACMTVGRNGKEMNEMFDALKGGARLITDDKRSIDNSGVALRCMEYANNINAKIAFYADDSNISGESLSNESAFATSLGLKGSPSIAESTRLQRDLKLAEYTQTPIHVSGISTKESVEILRKAKASGLKITAEVYIYHLTLTEEALATFDSNYKVKPPLRRVDDVEALVNAVKDGTIDMVVSDHSPENVESKDIEYGYAKFGMIGLETFYALFNQAMKGISPNRTAEILSDIPRQFLNLEPIKIEIGEKANFTVFNPTLKYIFTDKEIVSKSKNSPFLNKELTGKVMFSMSNNLVGYDGFK